MKERACGADRLGSAWGFEPGKIRLASAYRGAVTTELSLQLIDNPEIMNKLLFIFLLLFFKVG